MEKHVPNTDGPYPKRRRTGVEGISEIMTTAVKKEPLQLEDAAAPMAYDYKLSYVPQLQMTLTASLFESILSFSHISSIECPRNDFVVITC